MKQLLLALLFAATLIPSVRAASKSSTMVIHPGEVVYVRFEQNGNKVKMVSSTTKADDAAQVIFRLYQDEKTTLLTLKVENNFTKELNYKAEIRSLTKKKSSPATGIPVVAGKVAYEVLPPAVEEFAAFDFELSK